MHNIQETSLDLILMTITFSGMLCGFVCYFIRHFRNTFSNLDFLKYIFAGIFFCALLMLAGLFVLKLAKYQIDIGKFELIVFGMFCILASVIVTTLRFWDLFRKQ